MATKDQQEELKPTLYVLLDANAWIAEWLLFSAAGAALIDLLVRGNGKLLLPEVVEREVQQGALSVAISAVQKARNELSRLRQLTRAHPGSDLPGQERLGEAIRERIEALEGLIEREPFSPEIGRSALERVLAHKRPKTNRHREERHPSREGATGSPAARWLVHPMSVAEPTAQVRTATRR